MGLGYDLHRLTPGGQTVEHIDPPGKIETDGPWLFFADPTGNLERALPAHVVIDLRRCEGGGDCGATPIR